jgi:hypothetical protein
VGGHPDFAGGDWEMDLYARFDRAGGFAFWESVRFASLTKA